MQDEEWTLDTGAIIRRLIYMCVATFCAWLLLHHTVLSFQSDTGILYTRSFEMNNTLFLVTQTDLKSGAAEITAATSVKWLYYCNVAMLGGCALCFLTFFSKRLRLLTALITAFIAGAYYAVLTYYALKLADLHYVTIYPNAYVILPAIVIQAMIMLRTNIQHEWASADEAIGL